MMNSFPSPLLRSCAGYALFLFFIPFQILALQAPPEGGCFVYPSPAQGPSAWVVYILPESGTARIEVYNEAGDLVTDESVWNPAGFQQSGIDLTHYRRGVYICRVVLNLDSGGNQVLKLFKFIVAP